ncbi:hypothetical protein H6F77_21190 [Microcoleus sp. FACHB-831]|uniref:hypothetical protein n=1 Tax=Microcoleus sp. FACHB-831 TaxID=2692827 RepID=UPI001681D8C6|nr:hypothetical protein [Microcoleus sp. FACHB-831]MBD1923567.1 hypothetical protein [Microcoleus sp. FACHB-831]
MAYWGQAIGDRGDAINRSLYKNSSLSLLLHFSTGAMPDGSCPSLKSDSWITEYVVDRAIALVV